MHTHTHNMPTHIHIWNDSIRKVVANFVTEGESKVREAEEKAGLGEDAVESLQDLEAEETPETMLISVLTGVVRISLYTRIHPHKIHTFVYVHTQVHTHTHAMFLSVLTGVDMDIRTYKYVYLYTHVHTHTCAQVASPMHIHMQFLSHINTITYTYTCTHNIPNTP
jgi:hypothetical protein